jgi:hypothetical protein
MSACNIQTFCHDARSATSCHICLVTLAIFEHRSSNPYRPAFWNHCTVPYAYAVTLCAFGAARARDAGRWYDGGVTKALHCEMSHDLTNTVRYAPTTDATIATCPVADQRSVSNLLCVIYLLILVKSDN